MTTAWKGAAVRGLLVAVGVAGIGAQPACAASGPGASVPSIAAAPTPAGPADVYEARARGPVRAGFGEADITPDFPVQLSYGAREPTTGFYDRALVHALLLEVDDLRTLLLEFDVIGIRRNDADFIKAEVARSTGLDPRHIIVGATHNHSYARTHDERVRAFMAERAVDAVRQAEAGLFDARIGVGKTRAREDLNLNRGELHGIANPLLYVLRVDDVDGNLRGAMFNYGTHATIFTEWSQVGQSGPDWPGYVRQYVGARKRLDLLYERYQRKHDIDTAPVIMFSGGAAGDQQPRRSDITLRGEKTPPKKVFMEKLADEVVALIDRVETERTVEMAFRSKEIDLPRTRGDSHETVLQALVLNDAVLATIPGELGVDLGYLYEEASPLEHNMLITNADDYIGYIVPQHLALEQVTYQAKGVGFESDYGLRIIDEAVRLIHPDHADTPRVDPDTLLGSIAGTVDYDGDHVVAIGVRRIPGWPNYTGGFWGQRTVVGEDGRWRIPDLAPGTFYIYVAEADPANPAPTRNKSGFEDLRTLAYGYPVDVRPGEETGGIHFDLPTDQLDTDVAGLDLVPESLDVDGHTVSGAFRIEGSLGPQEVIEVGLFPADIAYRKLEEFLASPVVRTRADADGAFRFESVPPGRYRVVGMIDVNRNRLVELRLDVQSRLNDSPVLEVRDAYAAPELP